MREAFQSGAPGLSNMCSKAYIMIMMCLKCKCNLLKFLI